MVNNSLTYRIKKQDLQVYETKNGNTWKKSPQETQTQFKNVKNIANLYKQHNNLDLITDKKHPEFLQGIYSKGKAIGGRIGSLPDGTILTKAYPLFANNLQIHDETSHYHWDVLFQNPSGSYTYIYTKEKEQTSKQKKFGNVETFDKLLPKLETNLKKAIGKDPLALPMIILLQTKMRVGSERYYKKSKHKGLTTLQKKDLTIKGNNITFNYTAKDGVPMNITETFNKKIIEETKKLLQTKKTTDFIFTTTNGHPLTDIMFEKAFLQYTGKKFYPHIVRSHYATMKAKEFFKQNKTVTPKQVRELYETIAEKLGHKKYSKKTREWKDSYQVTIHYYVQEEIVNKIANITTN